MSAETLVELKTSRAATKGSQTKLKNYVDANLDKMNEYDLVTRLGLAETYFENFQKIQSQVERLDPNESETNYRENFEDTYCAIKSKLLAAQARSRRESMPSFSMVGQNSALNQSGVRPSRLPKLSLPRFSGKYTDWHDFYKTFVALVDNDDSLTTVEKFTHLRNCLDDISTSKTIRSLEMSEDNYRAAIRLLKERYENKRIIFNSHIRAIHDIKSGIRSSAALRDLIDVVNSNLRSLKQMGTDADIANSLLLFVVCGKLDVESLSKFEETVVKETIPSWEDLEACLSKRCQILETKEYNLEANAKSPSSKGPSTTRYATRHTTLNATVEGTANQRSCVICKSKEHDIYRCQQFDVLTPKARFDEAKRLSLCINCLQPNHRVRFCHKGSCRKCRQRHHTLLHMERDPDVPSSVPPTSNQIVSLVNNSKARVQPGNSDSVVLHSSCSSEEPPSQGDTISVILATAVVKVRDRHGESIKCRVLLDSGSQISLISECLAQILDLKRSKVDVSICGINQARTRITQKLVVAVESCTSSYQIKLEVFVVPKVTSNQPSTDVDIAEWRIPPHIKLADPEFYRSNRVDMLVGAEIFFDLLAPNRLTIDKQLLTLQDTRLGWIIAGKIANIDTKYVFSNILAQPEENDFTKIEKGLERFWIMDGFGEVEKPYTEEEQICEAHFTQNFRRDDIGRFIVKLPLNNNIEVLGKNYWIAKIRFLNLEKKLLRDPEIRTAYEQCMREYETLNHMQKIETPDHYKCKYFLPHHCVLKPNSSSTRLRVVFDASCKTETGHSLNSIMNIGPTIQKDLFSTLLRFRSRRYALTADITKMYRQILLDDEQSYLQCVLWRATPTDPIGIYRLKTVTFGTAAASFLAIRCLHQLAMENKTFLPLASKCIMEDFYVDDMLSGSNSFDEAQQLQREVSSILASAGFELRKWASNDYKLLENIPPEHREQSIIIDTSDFVKTLGLAWHTKEDIFRYKYVNTSAEFAITKRKVFSEIATLFDPLGLINPIIVKAKIFLQHLWRLKIDWDIPLPESYKSQWAKFREQLPSIQEIKIPRFVLSINSDCIELHGFADACNDAYGCCIYIRCVNQNEVSTCRLLCAKSRVAPIKTVSLPRLELCAAELLANLLSRVTSELEYHFKRVCCWTDSEIVLNWLAAHPSNWTTFVSNRVSTIQRLTENYVWNHIDTKRNPADLVSRGMLPEQLLRTNIWFVGPDFLTDPTVCWPKQRIYVDFDSVSERRKINVVMLASSKAKENIITSCKFVNSFNRLRRVFAYVLRFVDYHILKRKKNEKPEPAAGSSFTPAELTRAVKLIIRIVQRDSFTEDYRRMSANQPIPNNSYIQRLRPFIDKEGIIRVGGRLQESNLEYSQMHPILLPKNNLFVSSLVEYLHYKNLHAGPQALLAAIRQQYWVINGRDIARRIVQRCIICFKHRPVLYKQIMGNLPSRRVQPARPFLVSGVDFCGPVMISYRHRGQRPAKAYIAVFVCFTTKAVHLELVSNLSSDGFLAAIKRFVSRRGLCSTLYCDNATNFVGGRRQLNELRELFFGQEKRDHIIKVCAEDNISILHIPPRSPHFGGLWEAAVKSAKHHINRMLNNTTLTYEEFATVLAQVEAVLNSRPLTPMSSDPSDLNVLTPGHFLVGEALTAPLEPDLSVINTNRLSHYQLIRKNQQEFWERWTREYIVQLQQRSKWRSPSTVKMGTMVLVSEENIPPQKWIYGRIVEVHPGKDGIIRVVTVRTRNGLLKRSIQKLAPLPTDEPEIC